MSLQYYTECIKAETGEESLGVVKKFYNTYGQEIPTPHGAISCVVELPTGGFYSGETDGLEFVMVH